MRKALHFGAGNVGRGVIGLLLSQSGYQVVFVDIIEPLVELINRQRGYTVRVVGVDGQKEITVENVTAINAQKEGTIVEEISRAALITTAVGAGALQAVAPVIARGLQRRADLNLQAPMNIMACENLIDNSRVLQEYVFNCLSADYRRYVEKWVGFPNCVLDGIIITSKGDEGRRDPLSVVVEEHFQLVADRPGFVGEPPAIGGIVLTDKSGAYSEQKLFTFNTAHAIAAYLGYLKGHRFIHQAIRDPEIRRVVSGALQECSTVLIKRHNFDPAEQEWYAAGILKRFENAVLQDPVVRVAREPRRKLGPTDRLVKPAVLALESGVTPTYLATGIAAALLYDYPGDKQATALSRDLKEKGVDRILSEVCDLVPDSALAELVKERMVEVRARCDA